MGVSTLGILVAVRVLSENECEGLVLLKCTSAYPSTPENTNILTILHMAELFNCHDGNRYCNRC